MSAELADSFRRLLVYQELQKKLVIPKDRPFDLNDLTLLILDLDKLPDGTDFTDPLWGALNMGNHFLANTLKQATVEFINEDLANLHELCEQPDLGVYEREEIISTIQKRQIELATFRNIEHDSDDLNNGKD